MSREEIKNNTTLFLIVIIGAVFALVLFSNRGSMKSTGYAPGGTPSWCAVDCGAVPSNHPGSFWQQTGLCRASSTKSCTGKIYCKLYTTDANGNTKRVTGRGTEKDLPCPSSPPQPSRTTSEWQPTQNQEVLQTPILEDEAFITSEGSISNEIYESTATIIDDDPQEISSGYDQFSDTELEGSSLTGTGSSFSAGFCQPRLDPISASGSGDPWTSLENAKGSALALCHINVRLKIMLLEAVCALKICRPRPPCVWVPWNTEQTESEANRCKITGCVPVHPGTKNPKFICTYSFQGMYLCRCKIGPVAT